MQDLRAVVGNSEQILYEGKPDRKCYIYETVLNPLLPVAIIWAIIDFGALGNLMFRGHAGGMLFFAIPFMLLHLMPVWLYVGGIVFMAKRYQNTCYIVTDRAIYVSGGVFNKTINVKPFAELSHINLHRGIFDQKFNVGDIVCTTSHLNENGKSATIKISSIADYVEVYNLVKKLQMDVYTDVMYPNAKRPDENPGYNTKYKGL